MFCPFTRNMIIYLDTETTGLYPGNICQLSYVMQDKQNTTAKNFFFAVDRVEYGAYMVHGLSVEKLYKLSKGKRFIDFVDEIYADLCSAEMVVAHNISFDVMFLRKELERCGKDFPCGNLFCTMKQSTPVCKIPRSRGVGYKYPKLSELCDFIGVTSWDIEQTMREFFGTNAGYHDARFDTVALYLAVNIGREKIDCFDIFNRYI